MIGESEIAPDAWTLVQAFRDGGGLSFQDVGVPQARIDYETSCAANGLPHEDVARCYDVSLGENVSLRVYVPANSCHLEFAAAALFIHGGGWVVGSLDTHDTLCRHLANRSGRVLVAVDYRRAPEHRYPVALNDCRSALAWMFDHSAELSIDAARIGLIGDSAGGQMAAVLANESALGFFSWPVDAQVLLYPVTDVGMRTQSYKSVTSGFPLTAETMRWFTKQYLRPDDNVDDPSLSPLRIKNSVPRARTFICTVGLDPLADEGIAYAGHLAKAGTAVEHVHLPTHPHGLATAAGRVATGFLLAGRVAEFLAARPDRAY